MCLVILMITLNFIRRHNSKPCNLNVTDQSLCVQLSVFEMTTFPLSTESEQKVGHTGIPLPGGWTVAIICWLTPGSTWAHAKHPENWGESLNTKNKAWMGLHKCKWSCYHYKATWQMNIVEVGNSVRKRKEETWNHLTGFSSIALFHSFIPSVSQSITTFIHKFCKYLWHITMNWVLGTDWWPCH